jgi:hypothetical protein
MRRATVSILATAALAVTGAGAVHAATISKSYAFKANTVLQVGLQLDGGLRLDSIEFVLPTDDGSPSGLFNGPRVKVAISNLGEKSVKVGIAVAVQDGDGRLLAVASGGTRLFPLRADRQMVYVLDFGGVNDEIDQGTLFRISIEPRP